MRTSKRPIAALLYYSATALAALVLPAGMMRAADVPPPPTYFAIACKQPTGQYIRCRALNAERGSLPVWVYSSNPPYEAHGYESGPVHVREKKWTDLTFYITDAVQTHLIVVRLRWDGEHIQTCNPKGDCPR